MAGAAIGVAHCLALPSKFRILSLNASSSSSCSVPFTSLGFSSNLSQTVFSKGNAMQPYNSTYPSLFLSFCKWSGVDLKFWGFFNFRPFVNKHNPGPTHHSIVCDAAPMRKADSAAKRVRQAEKRRIYNKARKSEIRTRMKKVIQFVKKIVLD
ncbi:30S ribosomal protein S20, chloroplastic [Vitis vinifera]|uniref:30S ribosomal protein S20, chloroplastic n=1 Tax=Vitis vinifera TaxID=29760 RepID=A0A438H447_VITVI|nr:30S ribosomal protein S20, chloroplastic [Vitis vinifera]